MEKFLPFKKKNQPHSLFSKQCFQLLFLNPARRQFQGKNSNLSQVPHFNPVCRVLFLSTFCLYFPRAACFSAGLGAGSSLELNSFVLFLGAEVGEVWAVAACVCFVCVCPKAAAHSWQKLSVWCFWARGVCKMNIFSVPSLPGFVPLEFLKGADQWFCVKLK